MRNTLIMMLGAVTLLSGCGTYAGSGAATGASFGSMLGSAIGGIAGGPRGSDIGTLVGMAGGAMVGGAVGAQADKKVEAAQRADDYAFERKYREHRSAATRGNDDAYYDDGSGFDPEGRGDDVIYDFNGTDYTGNYTATHPEAVAPSVHYESLRPSAHRSALPLEIRNARFVDDNQNRVFNAGETCKVIFEIYNTSSQTVYDVQPMVVETTGNKNVSVSATIHVESIAPGKGVRYTALARAGKRLKDGRLTFRIYAVQGNNVMASNTSEFNVKTERR